MEECLILCNVVIGLEVELKGVPQFVTIGGYEENPRAYPLKGEGAIKVHCLVLYLDGGGHGLLLGPLGDEVNEGLGPDHGAGA